MPPVAKLGESFDSFFDAAEQFFSNLAAVGWGSLAFALLLHGSNLTLRTRAWFGALRAAYPTQRFQWRHIWAAQITGTGVNSVMPAHSGGILRLYLAKRSIPRSSYPTVGSSFLVEAVFDISLGSLLIAYGFSKGIFPALPDFSKLPAFDIAFFVDHPQFAVFMMTLLPIAALAAFAILSVRVRAFWEHVRQGLVVLTDRHRYVRTVLIWQSAGWLCRVASIYYMLMAFNLPATIGNVGIVLAVQGASTLMPIAPQGAGVQQALLVKAFGGAAAGATVAAYSVGQQLALAAFNVMLGFIALAIVFRTTDWRGLIATGREEQAADKRAKARAKT